MVNQTSTVINVSPRALAFELEARHFNLDHFARRHGISKERILDPHSRVPNVVFLSMLQEAQQWSGEEFLHLELYKRIPEGSFRILEFLVETSENLRAAFKRVERFQQLLNTTFVMTFFDQDNPPRLELVLTDLDNPLHQMLLEEATFYAFIERTNLLMDVRWDPQKIHFRHQAHASLEEYAQYFHCPLEFGAEVNALEFFPETLDIPMRSKDTILSQILEVKVEEEMESEHLRVQQDMLQRVKKSILNRLAGGDLSVQQVARDLGMSSRSLQRSMKGIGKTYLEVLEEVRCDLGQYYLKQMGLSLVEITFLLGFSDQSSFTRAFRRCSGLSPKEYRESALQKTS